ncbi:FtsQ-type POTRA domain-containing protein [Streptomyces sp. ZYX-F-203]
MAGPTATAERGARTPGTSGPARRPRLRGRFRRIVILGLPSVLLAASGWSLYGSDWFRVERVSVEGARVLTDDAIRDVAGVPLGDPLVSVDTDAAAERLRRELPRIDTVDVRRSWPGEIVLAVVERTPVLVVAEGDAFVEVDDDGVRYATVARAPSGVPLLDLSPRSTASGRFGEDRLAREAVLVAQEIPDEVARGARTVEVRSLDEITLELSDGRTVLWGSGERGADKARALTALMEAAPDARHFDVSAPSAPASSGS